MSSDPPLLPPRKFPGSLSLHLISILVPVLAPIHAPVLTPVFSPIPTLVLIHILLPPSVPTPIPVPVTVSYFPFLVSCSPLGTKSSGRRRVLRPKLLATCRRHLLSTEIMPCVEWQCLVFYSASFLMWRIPDLSSSPPSLSIIIVFPVSNPVPNPVLCFSYRLRPHFRSCPVSTLVPVPVPVLLSFARLHPRPRPVPVPVPAPVPLSVPTSDLVCSFPSLGSGYPLGTMHVYRPWALRTELSGVRKRHSLSVDIMTRVDWKCPL